MDIFNSGSSSNFTQRLILSWMGFFVFFFHFSLINHAHHKVQSEQSLQNIVQFQWHFYHPGLLARVGVIMCDRGSTPRPLLLLKEHDLIREFQRSKDVRKNWFTSTWPTKLTYFLFFISGHQNTVVRR